MRFATLRSIASPKAEFLLASILVSVSSVMGWTSTIGEIKPWELASSRGGSNTNGSGTGTCASANTQVTSCSGSAAGTACTACIDPNNDINPSTGNGLVAAAGPNTNYQSGGTIDCGKLQTGTCDGRNNNKCSQNLTGNTLCTDINTAILQAGQPTE